MIRTVLHKVLDSHKHPHMHRDPYFCFDDKVTELLTSTPAAVASIKALMEHGLVHLPYPQMTVQFTRNSDRGVTWLVWFQERLDGSFTADLFACRGEHGRFLSRNRLQVDGDAAQCFRAEIQAASDLRAHAEADGKLTTMADDVGYITVAGLMMAVLMTHIGGLEREEHETPEKLNAARERKGKSPIRHYTYVHVGHVYGSDGTKHGYNKTGRRMPIHMRAGHNRNQFYGKDRALRKLIWIPPVLVNYDAATEPVVEKRVVL